MSNLPMGHPTNRLLDVQFLLQQRSQGTFCDVLLQSTSGNSAETIRCHKIILAMASPYFRKILKPETRSLLMRVDHEALIVLVNYMYSAEVSANTMTLENIYKIYQGAREFSLDHLRHLCIKTFRNILSEKNVVAAMKSSLEQNLWNFSEASTQFVLKHLESETVRKDFLQLSIGTIRILLRRQNVGRLVSTEELLNLVTTWLKNRSKDEQNLYSWELIQDIPFSELSRESLITHFHQNPFLQRDEKVNSYYLEHAVVKENFSPSMALKRTRTEQCLELPDSPKNIFVSTKLSKPAAHVVTEKHFIFCTAEPESECRDSHHLMKMSLETLNVENIGMTSSCLSGNSISYYGGNVITVGAGAGNPGVERPKQTFAQTYNIESKERNRVLPSIPCRRSDSKSVILGKYLYLLGGYTNAKISNRADCLSFKSPFVEDWGWDTVHPMLIPRLQFGIGVLHNCIYVVGGLCKSEEKGLHVSDRLECFYPYHNSWEEKARMPTPRTGLAIAAFETQIFAMGGCRVLDKDFNPRNMLNEVEVYDSVTNTWKSGIPMLCKRKLFSAIVWDNYIYAIGGNVDDSPSVERFDVRTNTWTQVGKLPFPSDIFENVAVID